jgi:hypothetical protein
MGTRYVIMWHCKQCNRNIHVEGVAQKIAPKVI